MPIKILISDPIDAEGIKKLEEKGFEVDVKSSISKEDLSKAIAEYDGLVVRSRTNVTKEIIEQGKRLKVIARAGAGLDNIDMEAAKKCGVTVLNTPEAPADSVAELTVGLILALVRSITVADRSMKEGKWLKKELKGSLLRGKTLGLVGLGNIGVRVAKIAKEMGMKIVFAKRTPPNRELIEALGAEFVPLEELLKRSDIVSVHVPLNQQSYKMIGAKELSLMKKGAFLINTSRGAVIDEIALLDALTSGRLGGAALDVYESEPPKDLRLIHLQNVVCTPHIGAQTEEAQKTASILVAEKIIQFFEKSPPST